jgi:isoamylase
LLLSAGVPMILGGDEIGRTQEGNNNAYCQDDELSWYDWDNVDEDLLAFTKTAIRLRRDNPALRPRDYLRGPGGLPAQMVLYKADGAEMSDEDWKDADSKTLAVALDGRQIEDADGDTTRDRFLLLVNAHHEPVDFTVPSGGRRPWRVVLTTDDPDPIEPVSSGDVLTVLDRSILLLHTT